MTIVHEEKHNLCLPKPNSSHCTIIVTPSWAAEPKIKAILCTSFNSTKVSNAYHSKKNQTLHEDKHNWCLPKHSHDTLLSHRAQNLWQSKVIIMFNINDANQTYAIMKSTYPLSSKATWSPLDKKRWLESTNSRQYDTIHHHTTFLSMIPRQKVKCPRQWRDSILCSLQNPEHYSSVTITVTFCEQKQSKDIYIYIYIYHSKENKTEESYLSTFHMMCKWQVTKMNILVWHFSMSATLHQTLRFWPGFTNHHMSTSHCPSQNVIQ